MRAYLKHLPYVLDFVEDGVSALDPVAIMYLLIHGECWLGLCSMSSEHLVRPGDEQLFIDTSSEPASLAVIHILAVDVDWQRTASLPKWEPVLVLTVSVASAKSGHQIQLLCK